MILSAITGRLDPNHKNRHLAVLKHYSRDKGFAFARHI